MEHGEIERNIYAKRALGGTIIQDIMNAFIADRRKISVNGCKTINWIKVVKHFKF